MSVRAITVRQPWAWAIAHGGKDVENRTRNIAGGYRGPVAIHAGLTPDTAAQPHWPLGDLIPRVAWRTRGAVVAVADLVDVHDDETCLAGDLARLRWLYEHNRAAYDAIPDTGSGGLIGRARLCSPWAMGDHWHLTLANVRPLATPVPARGRLGLWTLPPDVEAAVLAQIGA